MGCTKCKKKKEITQLDPIIIEELPPSKEEIFKAFITMDNAKGLTEEEYDEVNRIYKYIFNEELVKGCGSCGQTSYRKFKYYIENVLKIQL